MGILLVYDVTDEKSFNSAFGFFTPLPLPIKLKPNLHSTSSTRPRGF